MRCATCGTENTADSRFCGGCGARLASSVAPTTKIPDDAPMRVPGSPLPTPPPGSVQRYQSRPPQSGPVSVARPASGPKSIPPGMSAPRPVSVPPSPAGSMASSSLSFATAPKRRTGLIVAVLLIDLGLAGAGAALLAKGLGKPDVKAQDKSAPPPAATTAPSPAPAPPPAPAGSGSSAELVPAPAQPVEPAKTEPATPKTVARPSRGKTSAAVMTTTPAVPPAASAGASLVTSVPTSPVDPYATPDLATEVDRALGSLGPDLTKCSTQSGGVHGAIRIAFRVMPDGHVVHPAAVENTTGSPALASCLITAIADLTVSPHSGDATDFVRPFDYP